MDHLLGKDYRSPVHVLCFFGRPNRAKPSIIGRMKLRLGSEPPPLGKNPGRYIYSWPQGTAQTTHECRERIHLTGRVKALKSGSPKIAQTKNGGGPEIAKVPKTGSSLSRTLTKKVNFSRLFTAILQGHFAGNP
jgi:hypothetical protein